MAQTSFLIVGLGRGAAWGREIRKDPGLHIAGLVDVDTARLAEIGAELGVPKARQFLDYQTALREAEADVVVLAVPSPLHQQMILTGLRAHQHVICEKPLAMNLTEARELREAVKQFDRRFMVGEQYRFADGVENLKIAIAKGLIGQPAYLSHEFYRGGGAAVGRWSPATHWSAAYVEGSLHDMSVHHFDMWYYITGKRPVEVYVKPFDPAWNQSGRRFGYSMHATLEDGTHVDYITARALARPQTTWYGEIWIVGDRGALYWNGDSLGVTHSEVIPVENQSQKLATENLEFLSRGITNTNLPLLPLIRSLLQAIEENRPHPCDIEDNWVSFATAMAAVESAQTGQTVKVAME
ncbi:MAG: Gfo/Idh/MocA family protein [Chloroflexota bacterium]